MMENLSRRLRTLEDEGFKELNFTPRDKDYAGEVYLLVLKVGSREIPFYIGRSTRLFGRMDDYYWAEFSAATDFKVGMAIRFLIASTGGSIAVKHKQVVNPVVAEKELLDEFRDNFKDLPLLNWIPGYDYRTATVEQVTEAVQSRCKELLEAVGLSHDGQPLTAS